MKSRFQWLRHLKKLYEHFGIDFEKMLVIMELKTKMLTRGWQSQVLRKKKSDDSSGKDPKADKDISLFNWGKSISYAFCSLFLMVYGFLFSDPGLALSICFLVCFVMQFLGVITDFPVIILDTKDSTILATKPVDTKTISAAKTTLAVIYMAINTVSLYSLIFIPFIVKMKWSIVVMMALAIPLSNLICVALAYYLYGMILKFFDGEKLKDMVSGFQILLTVLIMVGYQVVLRITDLVNLTAPLKFAWWHLLIPSYWLTYFTTMFSTDTAYPALTVGLAATAIIFTILLLHFLVTGQILEDNLNKMLSDGEKKRGLYELKLHWQQVISKTIFKKDHEAQAFYMLGYSVSGNDRKMKQTIYPLYVSMLIAPIIIFINMGDNYAYNMFRIMKEAPLVVLSLYFCAVATSSVVFYAKRTENPKGSWVYDVLPIQNINSAYIGSVFGLCSKFVWPPMLVISLMTFALGGMAILDDLILINASVCLMVTLSMLMDRITWPFSMDIGQNEAKDFAITFALFAMPFLFAGIHALVAIFANFIWMMGFSLICLIISAVNVYLLKKRKIKSSERGLI